MDLARPRTLKALETVVELGSFSQYSVWKKAGTSFETAHNLVRYLELKNVVARVGKRYEVTTWPGLLGLFVSFRTFPKPTATLQLAVDSRQVPKYLAEKGFVLCLTSAWSHYDDYLRDPQFHAYAPSKANAGRSIAELSQLPRGTTVINIYPQDIPVSPVKHGKNLATALPRTLLDLYSSHYAYATDNWIRKQAGKWRQE
ncbi:hypothetical protein HY995_00720 [Candidatus Micrarchaeota archaeon]|nr:hypothetical protein [Candidatus Micrarchaeota archaeon]